MALLAEADALASARERERERARVGVWTLHNGASGTAPKARWRHAATAVGNVALVIVGGAVDSDAKAWLRDVCIFEVVRDLGMTWRVRISSLS